MTNYTQNFIEFVRTNHGLDLTDYYNDFTGKTTITMRESLKIINDVCKELNLDPKDVLSKSRYREFAECRYIIMYILHEKRVTKKRIGELLGDRDRTTVINGLDVVSDLLATNQYFRIKFNTVSHLFLPQQQTN